jgi:hypothetical protein
VRKERPVVVAITAEAAAVVVVASLENATKYHF